MLDEPKPRSAPPYPLLALLAASIGGGAYWLGRRAGTKVAAPAVLSEKVASAAAPTAVGPLAPPPSPAAPAPPAAPPATAAARPDAPGREGSSNSPHHVLALSLVGSLDQTVEAASPPGVGPPLAMTIARLLVWWFRPAQDARPGDKLSVVYDLPGGASEPEILALSYGSQKLGRELRAFRWQPPGAKFPRYYTPDGKELEERLVGGPIDDYEQVTSLLRDGRHHKGVDFKAPLGTPVHSPVDGTILRRNWHWRLNGNCLEIADAKSGRHVIFLHLEEVPKSMRPGLRVHAGEQIALSGNTGHTTAPHLHYQIMSADGRVLDPFEVHRTTRRALPASDMGAFEAAIGELSPLLGPEQHAAR